MVELNLVLCSFTYDKQCVCLRKIDRRHRFFCKERERERAKEREGLFLGTPSIISFT